MPGFADAPYAEQLAALMDRCFGTADAYSVNLRALGHEAADVVADCLPLQLAWGAAAVSLPGSQMPGPAGLRRDRVRIHSQPDEVRPPLAS